MTGKSMRQMMATWWNSKSLLKCRGVKFYYHLLTKKSYWLPPGTEQVSEAVSKSEPQVNLSKEEDKKAEKEAPEAFCKEPEVLPPGWRKVENSEQVFYWDAEDQVSSWTAPSYKPQPWQRYETSDGAYWILLGNQEQPNLSFWECDPSWMRLQDHEGRVYWSSPERKIRFFELETI